MKALAGLITALVPLVCSGADATISGDPTRYEERPRPMVASRIQTSEERAVALGRALFFDTRLSADGSISCSSCHQPEHLFSDGKPVAIGLQSRPGTRNTPSLINVAFNTALFWDGRRSTLESQALDPFLNAEEHGLANNEQLIKIIRADPSYSAGFKQTYSVDTTEIHVSHIASALSSFQRTLIAADSAFDRYTLSKEENALSTAAKRGLALFIGPAGCHECHLLGDSISVFTDNEYHLSGSALRRLNKTDLTIATTKVVEARRRDALHSVLSDPQIAELGRFVVTLKPSDIGKFKTPTLRNVGLTAPYMHDGSISTLDEAVSEELYRRSDGRGVPITLQERADLREFLLALSSSTEALDRLTHAALTPVARE